MFVFFISEYDSLPEIKQIKRCLEQVAKLGDRIGAPLSEVDDGIAKEIARLSYAMFCYHKKSLKTFTVQGNNRLRNMRIAEDDDGFIDADQFILLNTFINNLEAFAELVSQSYILASPRTTIVTERLFCSLILSRYTDEQHPVFFFNRNGAFYVFDDEPTDVDLTNYITDYFSISVVPELFESLRETLQTDSSFVERQIAVSGFFSKNQKKRYKYDFISGAITFLDFLAWKGLWQSQGEKNPLEDVSGLIDEFRNKLDDLSQVVYTGAKGIKLSKLISISDTIAIFTPKVTTVDECRLIELHAELSRFILERCAKRKYPIRGAISFGDYSILSNIMIGPGIDECASWHETGNWIGVHLTPSAQIYWNDKDKHDSEYIYRYKVPVKSGLECEYCVKWEITRTEYKELSLNTKALLPEIASKYTNTFKFLEATAWEDGDNGKK